MNKRAFRYRLDNPWTVFLCRRLVDKLFHRRGAVAETHTRPTYVSFTVPTVSQQLHVQLCYRLDSLYKQC